jgi:hypothetical protein
MSKCLWCEKEGLFLTVNKYGLCKECAKNYVVTPNCPYCGVELEKKPKRKQKCQACGKDMYVTTIPGTKTRLLLTEEQKFDREWMQFFSGYGITQEDYRNFKEKRKSPFPRDIVWALFNQTVHRLIKENDFQGLGMIYRSMGNFLNEEGKNPFESFKQSNKMQLIFMKQSYVKKVTISSERDSCPECIKMYGKKYTIEKALEKMPIPNKNCSTMMGKGKHPFCRCMWVAEDWSL